jgi:hypothetical protein
MAAVSVAALVRTNARRKVNKFIPRLGPSEDRTVPARTLPRPIRGSLDIMNTTDERRGITTWWSTIWATGGITHTSMPPPVFPWGPCKTVGEVPRPAEEAPRPTVAWPTCCGVGCPCRHPAETRPPSPRPWLPRTSRPAVTPWTTCSASARSLPTVHPRYSPLATRATTPSPVRSYSPSWTRTHCPLVWAVRRSNETNGHSAQPSPSRPHGRHLPAGRAVRSPAELRRHPRASQ